MKLINTNIKDLKIIKTKIYQDKRGFLKEVFKENIIKGKRFIFHLMSFSKKNVLRGLHLQTKNSQAKIITVSQGMIFDVVIDLRKNSKTFGKSYSIEISDKSDFSLYVPAGFAHGFLCLSKECTVNYSCSQYREIDSELTLNWNDKKLSIKWPIKNPILSKKDQNGFNLEDMYKSN
tara:strand:- start:1088 stop:1615 length:528 start_codon:yes stop_codon:yes gene_type:complete